MEKQKKLPGWQKGSKLANWTPIRGIWLTTLSASPASSTKPAWMRRRKRHLLERSNTSILPRRNMAPQRLAEQNVTHERYLEIMARVLGAVDHLREILGFIRAPREKLAYLRIVESLQRRMGEGSYVRAWQEGQAIPVE